MTPDPDAIDWIALDWGTSRLRVFAMDETGAEIGAAESGDGMGALASDEFEPALLRLIGPWLGARPAPVFAAGMVGARQGWVEAPYAQAPCAPLDPARMITAPARASGLTVRIAPGVSQDAPPDVMRGEETQIAGFLTAAPDFDGVICLPGTHSKWVRVSAGEIVGFRTFMTGELFALLSERSILRHSVGAGFDETAFGEAVEDALARPEQTAARLFSLRAESLLRGLDPDTAAARLSGWLIGTELAAAKAWWLGAAVALIGDGGLGGRYRAALAAEGVVAALVPAGAATVVGLGAARAAFRETET